MRLFKESFRLPLLISLLWVQTISSCDAFSPFSTNRDKSRKLQTKPEKLLLAKESRMNENISLFPNSEPPFLAIITETCSCDSDEDTKSALDALFKAVSSCEADLVSIRVRPAIGDDDTEIRKTRLKRMIFHLLDWSNQFNFRVVVSNDWMETALEAGAHGIHFKESHRHLIPIARKMQEEKDKSQRLLVGTSSHTVESALDAWEKYKPINYFFAGTCFMTESHPEKSEKDLEGPEFPGQVKLALCQHLQCSDKDTPMANTRTPPVIAIGGLDASNCHIPLQKRAKTNRLSARADGIATIRAVLQSPDPGKTAKEIKENMRKVLQSDSNNKK